MEGLLNQLSVKSHGANINLHQLIIKLINAGKTVLIKDYGFYRWSI